MSTTEIEPRIEPGVPLVRDPDGLPSEADPHDYLNVLREILEDAEARVCCRACGPCLCPVPSGGDCPECGKELCPLCVDLRDKGQVPYAGS